MVAVISDKNRVYKKALVVGGLKKYVLDTMATKLARHGISVAWHWPMDRDMSSSAIPVGCEVVILLVDMTRNPDTLRKQLRSPAKHMGIPLIATSKSSLSTSLKTEGFEADVYVAPAEVPNLVVNERPKDNAAKGMALVPDSLPIWLQNALATGASVELTPDRETEIFELSKTRTFTISVLVTASIAERWVDPQAGRNTRNRRLIQRKADQLTRAFRRGEYQKSHQGLAFGRDGSLQDGQHRLWAVWLSEQNDPFDFLVTFGQSEEVIPVIDDVAKRTIAANRMIRTGDAESKKKVEAATIIHGLFSKDTATNPSYDECESYIEMFKDGINWAATLPRKPRVCSASVRGALAFAHKANPAKVEEFASQVIDGLGLQRGQPAHTLRMFLEGTRSSGSSTIRREISVKVLRACLAHLSNDEMPRLYATEEAVAYFAKVHGLSGWDGSGYRIPSPGDKSAQDAVNEKANK